MAVQVWENENRKEKKNFLVLISETVSYALRHTIAMELFYCVMSIAVMPTACLNM